MHIQQPQCDQHGQTVTKDIGTAYTIFENLSEGMVRRATAKATGLAIDHATARIVSVHTRDKHRIHGEQSR